MRALTEYLPKPCPGRAGYRVLFLSFSPAFTFSLKAALGQPLPVLQHFVLFVIFLTAEPVLHRSGEFIFRRPAAGRPENWASLRVQTVQPVLTCIGSVLFGLSPGLTLSNKPSALKTHVSAARQAKDLLRGAALLAAVPAAATVAALCSSQQRAWLQNVPGLAWSPRLAPAVSVQPAQLEATQGTLPGSNAVSAAGTQEHRHVAQPQSVVPVRQQVAMAKDLMLQLRENVWHGLEAPRQGNHTPPAVFHVSMSPGASLAVAASYPLVSRLPEAFSCGVGQAHHDWNHGVQVDLFWT